MDTLDFVKDSYFIENQLREKKFQLERVRRDNQRLLELRSRLDEAAMMRNEVTEYLKTLTMLHKAGIEEDKNFKNRRIDYLNDTITSALTQIFPEMQARAEISYDFNRKAVANVELKTNDGGTSDPYMEGKLLQYLVSLTAISGIVDSFGANTLYIDEAFGVAHPSILGELGDMLSKLSKDFQIVLVSQNEELYQNVPHRKFLFDKDEYSGVTQLISVTDLDEESEGTTDGGN